MGIFEGLEALGLDNIDVDDIYAEPKTGAREVRRKVEEHVVVVNEADLLFDKSYTCPVCNAKIKSKTVRTGKARLVGTDEYLRPKYDVVEPLKYDAISCDKCGYTALSRYYKPLASTQVKLIKEKISDKYKPAEQAGDIYTYDEAIAQYKLALLCAVVKMAKASEKAYICLKAGWLMRSYAEQDVQKDKASVESMENEFLEKAYEGYIVALEQENFPISGMDEYTLKFLLANLARKFRHFDVCAKLLADLLTSRACPGRIKDKALTLKTEVLKEMKKQ